MEKMKRVTELIDEMIDERNKRGICDDQSEILKNGIEDTDFLGGVCGVGSEYQTFRDWFMEYVYDEICDHDKTVLFYYDRVYSIHSSRIECNECVMRLIKRSITSQNSLQTIRSFLTYKKPVYNVSIWFGGEKFDVDNVAKWVLDIIQCINHNGSCWNRGYSDVLDSYVPIIRNDNSVFDLRVYKNFYKNGMIPWGTAVMIELKTDAIKDAEAHRVKLRDKKIRETRMHSVV